MRYFAASSLMTAFGRMPELAPWSWNIALDLGHIPKLNEAQQRVGFNGTKQEDLNRSPVFGRLRFILGLPGAFVAELGYTPPLSIAGAQPHDLLALSIGRRVYEKGNFELSMRALGQHGRVQGDITCPARLAGVVDSRQNPFGCRAPSHDQMMMNYYGIEATSAWIIDPWHAHASIGVVRTELSVQVDALTFNVNDRSYLSAVGPLPYATVGTTRSLDAHWNVGFEVLYVPLRVKREPNAASQLDALTSLRVQLLYRFD